MPGSQTYIDTCCRQLWKLAQWAMELSKISVLLSRTLNDQVNALRTIVSMRSESHGHTPVVALEDAPGPSDLRTHVFSW